MALRISPASLSDLPPLLVLMREMQKADPWDQPFVESAVTDSLRMLLNQDAYGLVYLAWQADLAVAYLVLCFDYSLEYRGKGAWVDELFVHPSHRGKGIATQLLDLAERVSREHHTSYLHLEVSHGNAAIELYRRRGFVDHHRFLMTKPLTP